MIIIMIASYIIITIIDTYKLFKNKEYGKLAIYYSMILVSITIGSMIGMDIKVPSPSGPIEQMVKVVVGK